MEPVKVTIYKGTTVGAGEVASATVNVVGGLWTYTSGHLNDGTYTAQATQEDAAENVGKSEPPRTFTIHTRMRKPGLRGCHQPPGVLQAFSLRQHADDRRRRVQEHKRRQRRFGAHLAVMH